MFIGTLTNVATVLVGSAVGAVAGSRFPDRLRHTVLAALGLLTAALGFRETLATDEFALVLGAVLLGAVIGESLRIEQGLHVLGERLQRRFAGHPEDPVIDVDVPETAEPQPHRSGFSEGFVIASLVF